MTNHHFKWFLATTHNPLYYSNSVFSSKCTTCMQRISVFYPYIGLPFTNFLIILNKNVKCFFFWELCIHIMQIVIKSTHLKLEIASFKPIEDLFLIKSEFCDKNIQRQ